MPSNYRFYLVGKRPVQIFETDDGGLDCHALDWETGALVRDLSYLRVVTAGGLEVQEVSEPEFQNCLRRIREERAPGLAPEPPGQTSDDQPPAEAMAAGSRRMALEPVQQALDVLDRGLAAFVEDSHAVGGWSIAPPDEATEQAAERAIGLLDLRHQLGEQIAALEPNAGGDARGTGPSSWLERFDANLRAQLDHVLVANPLRRARAAVLLMKDPGQEVPWWYASRNACDLRVLTSLALDELQGLSARDVERHRSHLGRCPPCRDFYNEARALAGKPPLELKDLVSLPGAELDMDRFNKELATGGLIKAVAGSGPNAARKLTIRGRPDAARELTIRSRPKVTAEGYLEVRVKTSNLTLGLEGWRVQGEVITRRHTDDELRPEATVPACLPMVQPVPLVAVEGADPPLLEARLRWPLRDTGDRSRFQGWEVPKEHIRIWLVPKEEEA